MDVDEWLRYGFSAGFCGPPLCATHDGIGTTQREDAESDDGGDPCIPVLRLYGSRDTKAEVETNHAPSVWRAIENGL